MAGSLPSVAVGGTLVTVGGIGVAVRTTSVGTAVGTSDGVGESTRVAVASTPRTDTCGAVAVAGTRVTVTDGVPVALAVPADETAVRDATVIAVDATWVAVEKTATTFPAPDVGVETAAVDVGLAFTPRGGEMMIWVDPTAVRTEDVPTATAAVPPPVASATIVSVAFMTASFGTSRIVHD